MKCLFWILAGLLLCGPAYSQLNESDSIRWQGKLTSTGSLLDGNVSRLLLMNKLELAHANKLWGVSTRNDYQYGTTRNLKTENDVVSYNFLYYKPLSRFYPYLMVLVETNYRRKIDFRYQFGPGVSYNLLNKKTSLLKLSLTASYENTQFGGFIYDDPFYNGNNTIETWRGTGRIYGRQVFSGKKIWFLYEFWWQQSVQYVENYRFHTEEGLEIPLSGKIAFRTTFRYSYENIELLGLKPYDLFWTYGLTLSNF